MTEKIYTFLNTTYQWMGNDCIKISDGNKSNIMSEVDFHRWTYNTWPSIFHGALRIGDVYDGYNIDVRASFNNVMDLLARFEQRTLVIGTQPIKIIFSAKQPYFGTKNTLNLTIVINDTFQVHCESGSRGSMYLKHTEEYDVNYIMTWRPSAEMLCCFYYNQIESSWDGTESIIETDMQSWFEHVYQQTYTPKLSSGLWQADVTPQSNSVYDEGALYIY